MSTDPLGDFFGLVFQENVTVMSVKAFCLIGVTELPGSAVPCLHKAIHDASFGLTVTRE